MTARSLLLLAFIAGVFVWIGSFFGPSGAAIALSIAIVWSFWSYWSAAADLLARVGAYPCRNRLIEERTRQLAKRAGIPAPKLYVIDDPQPNALALGPHPAQSVIVLTSSLCAQVDLAELDAVLAHEIAHIRNRDILALTIAASFIGAILGLSIGIGLIGLSTRRQGGGALLIAAVMAPLIAVLVRLAMARSAEYRADREAAALCGGPGGLIAALQRLTPAANPIASPAARANPAFAAGFFVDPLPQSGLRLLFSPHPPVHQRIARLRASFSK